MTDHRFIQAFGPHLMLDDYGCPKEVLSDIDLIYSFLDEMPDTINMTKIMPPYVFKYHGKVPEDWGLSGFVLIAESHISVHTFPSKGFISIDAFSCKEFDHHRFQFIAMNMFQMAHCDRNMIDRGLEFPRNLKIVEEYMRVDRYRIPSSQ